MSDEVALARCFLVKIPKRLNFVNFGLDIGADSEDLGDRLLRDGGRAMTGSAMRANRIQWPSSYQAERRKIVQAPLLSIQHDLETHNARRLQMQKPKNLCLTFEQRPLL